jgi:ATP-binding cassette subfamily B protein
LSKVHAVKAYFVRPGESTWDVPGLWRNSDLARRIESSLRRCPPLTHAHASAWTGRVRVKYPSRFSAEEAREQIEAALRASADGAPSQHAESHARSSPAGSLRTVLIGAGIAATAYATKAAARIFPRTAVLAGLGTFVGTVAAAARNKGDDTAETTRKERDHALRELLALSRPHHRTLQASMALTVAARAMQVSYVALVGTLTDSMIARDRVMLFGRPVRSRPPNLLKLGAASVALIAGCSVAEYYSKLLWMRAAHRVIHDLRLTLYEHVQSLEMDQLADASRGNHLTLLSEDINRIELLFSSTWAVWNEIAYASCSTVGFFLINPGFVGLASVPMPGLLWFAQTLERRIRPKFAELRRQVGVLNGVLAGNVDGISTIRAFAAERSARKWVEEASAQLRDEQDEAVRLLTSYNPAVLAAANGLRMVTAVAAGFHASRGQISPGTYVTLVILSTSLALPMLSVARDFPHILSTLASVNRVFEAFDAPREERDAGRPLAADGVRGAIRFESVRFAYRADVPILQDVSVTIPAGRTAAFVGTTGAGKSTIAKLLLRFYEPGAGRILLDEQDVSTLRRGDVRRCIAYVGQEIFLFNGTIGENIVFGRRGAGMDAVVRAARAAGAHEFISALPEGYDTHVGEQGQKLSGGQRQRIGIARALLDRKPIVILDEVTAALDAVTEAELLRSLTATLEGSSVVIIAHRLSAVRHADAIHVMENGRIVESGSHEELLASRGRYATYWALQMRKSDAGGAPPEGLDT